MADESFFVTASSYFIVSVSVMDSQVCVSREQLKPSPHISSNKHFLPSLRASPVQNFSLKQKESPSTPSKFEQHPSQFYPCWQDWNLMGMHTNPENGYPPIEISFSSWPIWVS
jgi:hypothetical protein